MAKKQTSVRKREREALKRQRALAKTQKAAEKRELRHNKANQSSTVFATQPIDTDGGPQSN